MCRKYIFEYFRVVSSKRALFLTVRNDGYSLLSVQLVSATQVCAFSFAKEEKIVGNQMRKTPAQKRRP
jgi:hypothetical protein